MLKCSICGKQYKTTIERARCEIECAKKAEEEAEANEITEAEVASAETLQKSYEAYLEDRAKDRANIISLVKQQCDAVNNYIRKHESRDFSISQLAGIVTLRFFDDDGEYAYSFVSNTEYKKQLMQKHDDTSSEKADAADSDEDTKAVEDAATDICSQLAIL